MEEPEGCGTETVDDVSAHLLAVVATVQGAGRYAVVAEIALTLEVIINDALNLRFQDLSYP